MTCVHVNSGLDVWTCSSNNRGHASGLLDTLIDLHRCLPLNGGVIVKSGSEHSH